MYLLDGRPLAGPSGVRGIGTYARGLLGGLTELGVAGRISVLLARGAAVPQLVIDQNIAVAGRLPTVKRRLQPVTDALTVVPLLWRARPRVYHALEWAQPLLPVPTAVVVTVHDLIPFLSTSADYTWMRRERLLALRQLGHADAVIAVSRCTAGDVARVAHVDPARIHVVPHGVSPRLRPPSDGDIAAMRARRHLDAGYVIAVGTFDDRKRAGLALDVLRRLERSADLRMVVTGDQGSYAPRLRRMVEEAGMGDRVILAGHVGIDELRALYGGAICLLFTSAYEGFGLPVLEAMACGTPVVACRNSAIPEVAGSAGVLTPDGDVAAMADAVLRLLGDPAEHAHRSAAGREWAAGFTWQRCAGQTLAVYGTAERSRG